jgi:hypothetical protein
MKKIVEVTVKLVLDIDPTETLEEVMDEMNCTFSVREDMCASVSDEQIENWEEKPNRVISELAPFTPEEEEVRKLVKKTLRKRLNLPTPE